MSTTVTYKGSTLTTADNNTKTLKTAGKYLEDDITLVDVSSATPTLQTKTNIDPTTSSQTITADSGYDGLDSVQINAMPTMTLPTTTSNSSSGIAKANISANTGLSDKYLNIPTGYNGTAQYYAVKPVARGSVIPCDSMAGSNSTISYSQSELGDAIILTNSAVSNRPIVETVGYISSGTTGTSEVRLSARVDVVTTNSDLTVSGKTVTVPTGYYPFTLLKDVATGTAGTPTATKGTVSDHSISVTPSVTNTTGYITGSTINGTAVTVSASELVSGSETKTANGTYDVTNLAELVVNVSSTNSYTQIGSNSYNVSTTSTSGASVATLNISGAAIVQDSQSNVIYIRIRDSQGMRAGYFFGSDTYSVYSNGAYNLQKYIYTSNNGTTPNTILAQTSSGYGVYTRSITSNSSTLSVSIYKRYNASSSLTINGTYNVTVYILRGPNNKSPWVV